MTVINDAEELWRDACEILSSQLQSAVWMSVFAGIRGLYLDENTLTIAAPNRFVRDRIDERFRTLIIETIRICAERDLALEVRVDLTQDAPRVLPDATTDLANGTATPARAIGAAPEVSALRQAPTDAVAAGSDSSDRALNINPRYTFQSFVIGESNRFAHAAALSVAERPARGYNPLFIYGSAGLGKTHLLHAIAHYVHLNYGSFRVRYISTETLLNEFIDAIRNSTQSEFKRRYREIDVLLVDDVQFLEGKEQLQDEFFHTFDTLYQADRQIVLSSDRPPDSVATLQERLISRFKMGLVTDIQPPDFETRLAILRAKAADTSAPIGDEVLAFIAQHVTNNIRELEGALTRVGAYVSVYTAEPTIALARQVLGDIVAEHQPRKITAQLILETTSSFYGFTVQELTAKDRRRPVVLARQVCMYLFRYLTDLSFPEIGRHLGGRDHTTVMYAYDKIKNQMNTEQQIYDDVTRLIHQIRADEE